MTINRRTLLAGLTAAATGLGGRSQDCQAADENSVSLIKKGGRMGISSHCTLVM